MFCLGMIAIMTLSSALGLNPNTLAQTTARSTHQQDADSAKNATDDFDTTRLNESNTDAIIEAFRLTHDGYSSDEVVLQDHLQTQFLSECQSRIPGVTPAVCNWTLLNLRKQGKLSQIKTTKTNRRKLESVRHLAEIVARSIQDSSKLSIDRIMCHPDWRLRFDTLSQEIDPSVDLYAVRKAAFQLRKARQLKPELITRIADWGRQVTTMSAAQWADDLTQIPAEPGIYIFADRQGYLYIGEAADLRKRLTTHLDQSDRQSLATYLQEQGFDQINIEIHTFAQDSRIKELAVRRAYESELIRSRNPRFNIRP